MADKMSAEEVLAHYGASSGTSASPSNNSGGGYTAPAGNGSNMSADQVRAHYGVTPASNSSGKSTPDYGFTKTGKISRGTPVTMNDITERINDLYGAYNRLGVSVSGRSKNWYNTDIQGRWNDYVKSAVMDMNNERLAIMKFFEDNDFEGAQDYWKDFDDLGTAMVDMMSESGRQTSLMKEFQNGDDYNAWWEDQHFQQEWWQNVETANMSPFVAHAIEVNHQKEAQTAYDAAKKKLDQIEKTRSSDAYDDGSPMVSGNGNEVHARYRQQVEQEFREARQALNEANKRLGYAQKYLASDHDMVAQGASILSDNIEYRKQQQQAALDEGRFDENGNEVIASWDNQQREILDAYNDKRMIDWSDSEPTERWTQQERDSYQSMLTINPEEAKQYAISLNQQYNSEAKQQKLQGAYAFGAGEGSSHWSKAGRGAASTAAFLAAAPIALKDYMDKVASVAQKGYYVDSGVASLNDYAGAMVSGRAEQLNKDFSKLSIGGKGVGDLYQLANSALQSYVYGNLMGETGTLVAFFGSAANSGFDEAIQRGANGGQAALMGLLSGIAETLGEKVSLENLLEPDLEASFIKNLLTQSGIEGSEEAFTDILNDLADRLVMGDRSKVKTELYAHMAEGMSYDEARRAAWGDFVKDVVWDAVGGFISGGMGMGMSYGAQAMTKYNGEYGADAKKLVEEAKSGSSQTSAEKKAIAKAEGKLKDNKSISMTDAGKLVKAGNRAAMVNATEAQIKASGTELDDKTARSLANAIVAKNNKEKLTSNQQRLLQNNESIANKLLHDLSSKRITEQYDVISAKNAYDDMTEAEKAHLFSEEATESEKQLRETLESAQLPGLSTWATQIGLRGEKAAVYGDRSQVAALNMRRDYVDAMNNVKSRMTVTYDRGQQGTITGVERGEDGKVTAYTLDTGNGTISVAADKLSLTKGQKAIAEIMTDDVYAGAKIKAMENGQNVVAYSNEFEAFAEVYGHASSKNNFEQAWAQFTENNKSLTLTEAQAKVAFEAGKNLRTVDRTTSTLTRHGTGEVNFDKIEFNGTEYKAPSEQEITEFKQSDRYKYLKAVAKSIGVDLVFYKGGAMGANGQYLNGTVYLAIDAANSVEAYGQVQGYVMLTAAHELTHYIREASPAQFNKLRDFVVDHIIDKGMVNGKSMEQLFMEKRARYSDQGAYSDIDSIMEEIVADACQVMLRDNNLVLELKGYDAKLHGTIRGRVLKFINQVRQAFLDTQGNQIANEFTMSDEAKAMDDVFVELQKIWNEGLVQAAHAEVAHYTEVENESGKTVMATDNAGHAQLSLKTYEDGGREKLEQFLDQRVQEGALDKTERDQMLQQMNELYEFCQKKAAEYTLFGEWSRAVVKTDPVTGNAVFSVVKANGDYALNLDFSLICKKRRTLDAVFNQMIQDGIMDDFDMKEDSIAAINDIIRAHDFETACALCFVDSKRYRQAMVADSFVNMYNPLVRSMAPKGARIDFFNFGGAAYIQNTGAGIDTFDDSQLDFSKIDKVLEAYGEKTVMYKIAQNLKEHPEDRKLVQRGDFMSSAGFDNINQNNKRILGLYNSKKGAGGPKASQSDVQYLSEILDQNRFNADAAYSVGGVRVQSFSDYVPRLVFDYLQMFADMSAKELPAHAYTKEAMFALQFGLMGIKTNMSLVPEVIADGVAPGLDANGNYAWRDGQSFGSTVYGGSQAFIEKCFDIIGQEYHGEDRLTAAQGFELAKAIQKAAGYTDNCGTIAVGVSNEHIRKLLADPDIRMVIPYHKSSLNHIVAVMTNIDKYKDYTSAQNTRKGGTMDKDGHYTGGSKITKSEDTFNFNDTLRELGDAKAAANAYLEWCDQNGYTPKFDDFRGEDNYYKLLEDFSCYNETGVQTPQQGVSFTLPGTNSAFGDIQSMIELGLEEDAILQGNQDAAVPAIIEDIKKILPGMEQARRDAEAEKRRKAAERKAKKEAQGKLSLKQTTDGRSVAVVDNDVLAGIDTNNWTKESKQAAQKAAAQAMKQFKDGIPVYGTNVKVNKTSRDELTRNGTTEKLYKRDSEKFADKLRTSEITDDVIIATSNWTADGYLKHDRDDNLVDFIHGDVLIAAGDNKYIADAIIGVTDQGDLLYYGLGGMNPAAFEIETAEDSSNGPTLKDALAIMPESSAVEDSIAQQETGVNDKNGKAQLKVTSTAERELNAKQRSLDRLARQNELLEQRVEYWRSQTKLSKDNARAHTEVEAFVKDLLARSDSITDRAAAIQQIQELANIVTSGRLTDANVDEVSGAAYALAEKILDESEVVVDDSMVQARNDIIDYLKHHTITLSEGDKTFLKQRFGSVSEFRKQGSNNAFRFGPNGISIDQAYQDIRSRDGLQEMFPADMQAGDNQFEFIAKQLESFKETKANPHSANILEERNIVFNEIMDFLFDEDARIEKTFADKAQEKLDRKQQQVDRQKEQIGRQRATIAEQKERIKGQREQLDKQKQQAQAKIDAKQGTIDRQRDQLELERQRTANQKERVEKQKAKTAAQKAQTEKQKERVDKQKAKTAEQKAKTDAQKAANADLKAQLAESRQEMKDLQKESKDRLKQLKASAMAEKEAAVMKEKADKWSKVDSVRKMYQARAKAAQQRRANTEMRGKIRDLHAEMSNRLRHSTEKSYVPAEFRASMAEILQMVNLDSGRSKALAARINALNVEYQAIKDHSEYGIAYDETIGNMITDLAKMLAGKKDTSIYNLTGAELEAVYNTMKAIDYTARFAADLVAYNYNKDIFRIGVDLQREVELSSKAGGNLFNKYYFASMRPETFFQRMAGYAKNSTWSAMSDMLNEGQRKQTQLMMEGAQFFEELMNNDKLLREMTNPKKVVDIGLKDSEGNTVEVTMDIALKIYMDLMAEDNTRHIMYGGLIVPNIKEYYNGHMSESYGLGSKQVKGYSPELWALQDKLNKASSDAERAAIEVEIDQAEAAARNWVSELSSNIRALMGDYEKQWVDSAIKFFEWSKKNLNETSNAVWGFDKGNVDFYVPIHTSQDYRQASFENLKRDFTLEGSGFTKARVMSKSPMQAEGIIDVVSTHCNNIAKYCGMMPATRNFSKVFGTTISSELNSLQRSIDAKFGSAAIKYIDNLMTDLQSSRQATVGGMGQTIDGAINWMRGNMAAASLTMNLGTALGQAASLPTAAAVIGYAPIIKSFADAKNNPMINEQAREEIAQWSPLLWYRMQGYFDRDVGDLRSSNSIAAQAYDKLGFLTKWIETMDGLTVGQLWYAAQYYVEDQTDLERGTDEFMRETAKVFNKVVEQTQPNYTTFQRPDVLRDPSAFVKVTTMFMTQRLQNLNIMYDAAGKYNRYVKDFRNGKNGVTEYDVKEAKLGLVRAATSQLAAASMIVLFKFAANALLYNMKPYRDDDDELTKESIISNLVRLTAESLISNFLFGTELYEFARAMITGEKYYGISLSGIDTFTDFLTAISNTRAKMGGDDKEKTTAALMALAKSVATLCGIPASNIQKFYNAIAYRINDAEQGNGRWSFESEITRKDSYYHNKMYEAIVSKDKKAIETLNERYASKADRNAEMKKQIVARFKNDTLTDDEAVKQLIEITDMSEYDAEREIAKLKCEKEQGFKFDELKQQYLDDKITKKQAIEFDQKYGLYDEKSAAAAIERWTCEKDTGYDYDKLQQYIAAKDITEEQAIAYRIKYGGQEEEDALLTVSKWMCEIETDIPYDQLEEVFAEGGITREELKRCYMDYGLKDEETAEGIVQKREFIGTDDELEDVTVTRAKAYFEYFPDGDMDKRLYLQAQSDIYEIRADVNSKGKTISGSALKKKLVYIDNMSLQPWQKTAMAHAVGITDKQLTKYKAKWI